MPKALPVDSFLKMATNQLLIDVRSPAEYAQAHIPGAVNIPIFSNAERAEIGKLYKNEGKQTAFLKGLDLVGPKMSALVKQVTATAQGQKNICVYCWRGGMRSQSFSILMEAAGFQTNVLIKGYKSYRSFAIAQFAIHRKLLVLGGKTGSGKTEILRYLKKGGVPVLDLEALANHKGSAFGSLGQPPQPSNEHFENLLCMALLETNPEIPLWVEDESKTIGKVFVPLPFWNQLRHSDLYYLEIPLEVRLQHLLKDYGNHDIANIEPALEKIKKRLGGLAYKEAKAALVLADASSVMRLVLNYYDRAYIYGMEQRKPERIHILTFESGKPEAIAEKLLLLTKKTEPHISRNEN